MGDAADMILEGLLCEQCGELIDGEEPGYPRLCLSCDKNDTPRKKSSKNNGKKKIKGKENTCK